MIANVEMDIFGIIVLFFFWHNQQRSGSLSLDDQLFNNILIFTIVEQLMDAGQWALDGAHFFGAYQLQMLCYSLGFAVAPVITCLWVMYCDIRVNMDEHGLKKRMPLYLLPILLNALLLFANLFIPLVFKIDEAHIYHRGRFFWVYMVLMYLYGVYSLSLVARKTCQPNPSAERVEFRYIASFIILPLIGGALQWAYYGLSIIWLCMTLSIIMVYTKVLSRQILTDPLTGLNNRRKLNQYLGMKINATETNQTLFLMIMDADDFKCINDRYGHTAGDRALVAIAEIIKAVCSHRGYFLARLGGDEFLVIGHDQEDMNPKKLSEQIEERMRDFNAVTSEPFQLSLSIGWAYFLPGEMKTADGLLNAADQSMYQVKHSKRIRSTLPNRTCDGLQSE
jgi:diguanylate cyclase (GGDEF)-like protein